MAVAVKVAGDPWWARMDEGLKEYGQAHPELHVFMQGVSHADGALQAQLIEDLIAQKVDALGIVPPLDFQQAVGERYDSPDRPVVQPTRVVAIRW